MSDATATLREAVQSAPEAEPSKRRGKSRQHDAVPYDISFPPDCPVEPLGIHGDAVYFLDQKRQLRAMAAKELGNKTILTLFGDAQHLRYEYWPRYSKPNEEGEIKVLGWRPEQAADALYAEAARRGIWDVMDRVRGRGCWQDEDGQLVMHCGDQLYHTGKLFMPGKIGRHVYPAAPAVPHPARKANGKEAAEELLTLLKSWNWRRPDVDPQLLLGWIAAALFGGALKWRPLIWITGDKATGKSTLHDVLKAVIGPGGLIASTDASAAALWQTVGHDSLPVALDELESEQDNRKAQNIIKLARHAASGGQTLRGGSDHKGSSFTVRSCFLFSSILIPPMLGQDVSRMAILQLDKLQAATPPNLEPKRLAEIGAALRLRVLQEWPRMNRLIETWKHQLAQVGHGGRGADQFGTLLACYDMLLQDHEPDSDTLGEWAVKLDRKTLAECEDDVADHERCMSFLLTTTIDLYRSGERRTVGSWIQQAGAIGKVYSDIEMADANRALGNIGMMVKEKRLESGEKMQVLYIANDHQGLAALFKESHWAGQSGTNGVWVQAMRRVKGNWADQQRFNGIKKRCTAIPLGEVMGGDDEQL